MSSEKPQENLYSSILPLAQKYSTDKKGEQEACSMILDIIQGMEDEGERTKFLLFLKAEKGETLKDLTKLALRYFMEKDRELAKKIKEMKNSDKPGGETRARVSKAIHDPSDKQRH